MLCENIFWGRSYCRLIGEFIPKELEEVAWLANYPRSAVQTVPTRRGLLSISLEKCEKLL
ncbi:hypothetical protein Plhal710r2_c023g0093701 [Plasmopara halstedii]